jgi:hypothetical protein
MPGLVVLKFVELCVAIAFLLVPTVARTQSIPTSQGWYQVPNTKISSVCAATNGFPQISGVEGCTAITEDWSGGVFDSTRNRLIVWGGGHSGYYGNELYAINLNTLTTTRITNPSTPTGLCQAAYNDGKPSARHTYNNIAYMPNHDGLFSFSGIISCADGSSRRDTWFFDFSSLAWTQLNPSGSSPSDAVSVTDYDPNTGKVFIANIGGLFSYDKSKNAYMQHANNPAPSGMHAMTGSIDPVRKKFVIIGQDEEQGYTPKVYVWNIDPSSPSAYTRTTLSTAPGCSIGAIGGGPGVAYHNPTGQIAIWVTGNSVQLLNIDTGQCTTQTFSNGPSALANGTFGRWRYSPASDVFVVVNSVNQNAYTLKLSSSSSPRDTSAPSIPSGLANSVISSSQINLYWNPSSDNVGVTGYNILRCQGANCTPVQLATTISNSFSDTALAANTSYIYKISAFDASGNVSLPSAAASATTRAPAAPTSADADFKARCSAAGVLVCRGFDDASDFVAVTSGNGLYGVNGDPKNVKGTQDTTNKMSGRSALKFEIPRDGSGGVSGYWLNNLGKTFGQNSTFYVQFAYRVDSAFANIDWYSTYGTQPKIAIIYGTQSCSDVEITPYNRFGAARLPAINTNCGNRTMVVNISDKQPQFPENNNFRYQQGNYDCRYTPVGPTEGKCFQFAPNQFYTLYFKVTIGNWNVPNSSIEAWVATNGGPYQKFIEIVGNWTWGNSEPAANPGYANIQLTDHIQGALARSMTAYVWYDELIVSTQPIAAPSASSHTQAPAPPSNPSLTLQ